MKKERQRSPQEKKALSYRKDCRNCYGENSKSSRKAIPLRKKLGARARRKMESQLLQASVISAPSDADIIENKILTIPPPVWRKYPDVPLALHVKNKRRARQNRVGLRKKLANQALQTTPITRSEI